MGAINNAFNQATGAVAGAALAYQHAKESDFSKANAAEHAALIARNQASAAEAEYDKANAENFWVADEKGQLKSPLLRSIEADMAVDKAQAAFDKASSRKNASIKTKEKKFNDLAAAVSARDTLKAKIEAIDNMRSRAVEQIKKKKKATKIAEKAQQKYQSRWGGNK